MPAVLQFSQVGQQIGHDPLGVGAEPFRRPQAKRAKAIHSRTCPAVIAGAMPVVTSPQAPQLLAQGGQLGPQGGVLEQQGLAVAGDALLLHPRPGLRGPR